MDKEILVKTIPSKETRWKYLIALTVLVTGIWLISFFTGMDNDSAVTFEGWLDFTKWAYGLYALSEVGSKGATAVMNRNG